MRTQIKALQKGRLADDTSFVYALPFEPGKRHRVVQGYFGPFSHRQRAALDFHMKTGTPVTAVRDGIVVDTKSDGTKRGLRYKYKSHNNFVLLRHADGFLSGYYHLRHNGVMVQKGDSVQQGQRIGLSGNTGYSAFPHLHFFLVRVDSTGKRTQIANRFVTHKGSRYLKSWHSYKHPSKSLLLKKATR